MVSTPPLYGRIWPTGRYAARREAAYDEACGLRITAVPTFVFGDGAGDGVRVVGAQPLDEFRRLLEGWVG